MELLEPERKELEEERLEQVRGRGEVNERLEKALPEQPREAEVNGIQDRKCQLCKIDKPTWSHGEDIYLRGDGFYIVDTAGAEDEGRKGHEVRNMAVLNEHGRITPEIGEMMEGLVDTTSSHIQEGYMVVYGSMQTFDEHQHVVASDVMGEDMADINNYVLYQVEDGEPELEEYGSHDSIGRYIQEALDLE